MKKLIIYKNNSLLIPNVEVAVNTLSRLRGLIGCKSLPEGCALYIPQCKAVHTCFMKFSLDLIFIDGDCCVRKIVLSVAPFRFAFGTLCSSGVLEMKAGWLNNLQISAGDCLKFKTIL
jgi:uncharacterized protein